MKQLSIFLVFFLILFCKKNNDTLLSIDGNVKQKTNQSNIKGNNSCEEIITKIVKSSNANAVKNYKDLRVKIESFTNEKIRIKLYVTNDVSEDSSVKNLMDQTVGWLEFFPSTHILQDITNNIETPEGLKFDTSILENSDIIELCYITKINENVKKKEVGETKVLCYEVNDEKNYVFSKICHYEGVEDSDFLYKKILERYKPDDLLQKIPQKDTIYSTQKVPKIQYLFLSDTIKIRQFFDGGETEYLIYKKKNIGIIEERSMPD